MNRSSKDPAINPASPMSAATTADARWADVLTRNPEADGRFWYSVKTTGVYCKPSCASRQARPEHVRFHDSRELAEAAGFRPCKRCKPDQTDQDPLIAAACRAIEAADSAPNLETLARQAGWSVSHFHRRFKSALGLTPRQYAAAVRAQRLRAGLDAGLPVSDAIYAAGYGSSGRFYENSNQLLGMTPTDWRNGGDDTPIVYALGSCSLGTILVAQSARGICAILLGDQAADLTRQLHQRFHKARLASGDAVFEQRLAAVIALVDNPTSALDLPLDVRGTAFTQRVWQALCAIPAGTTTNYADIARRVGAPGAARAVGRAIASNTLAVLIPCHRVVRKDGTLGGYRWGEQRKRALLEKEAALPTVQAKKSGRID